MVGKVLGRMAIILNQQNRTRGNLGVVIHEVHHLLHADGGIVLIMQCVHQLTEVMNADLVWIRDRALLNSVKHDRDYHRAWHSIGRSPFGFEILTFIVDIHMRRIKRVEGGRGKRWG